MKYFLSLTCALTAFSASAATIERNTIEYIRAVFAQQSGGYTERMAAVGGKVDFIGEGPVFVTLVNGGQHYSSITDQLGRYSFFIWTNNDSVETFAWTVDDAPRNGGAIPDRPLEPFTKNSKARAQSTIK